MDPICDEIYNILQQKNYRLLFNYDEQSIQIFFDELCKRNEIANIDILVQLFPRISIINAITYAYIENNAILFEILSKYITEEHKSPNLINTLLIHSHDFHKGDRKKYILPNLLQLLLKKGIFGCDDILISASELDIPQLAKLAFANSTRESKLECFRIAYKYGFYDIAVIAYKYIRDHRIFMDATLGYCPSGQIIELINYQEFYNWNDLFSEAAKERNYYVLEVLINKMPYRCNIQFSMLIPILTTCPDSILILILQRFSIKDIDLELIKYYKRKPLTDYAIHLNLGEGWKIISEEKVDFI